MSALEKIYNSVVSKCRIYIEHINRYIKRFRIIVVPNERTSGSVRVNISQVTEKGRKMENRSQR